LATSLLLFGWATGGIIFGIMGDRIGRVKTMVCTILSYSLFTGLSGFAFGLWDFLAYRFIAGLGVGGQFAVGVSLVAESLPGRARPHALGALQAFSAVGNIGAGVISLVLFQLAESGAIGSAWRWMFAIGVLPALLAVVVMSKLREPEAWVNAKAKGAAGVKTGSLAELFGDRRWRNRTIIGMVLASAGVIGLWAIGVFSNDLTQSIFRKQYQQEAREAGQAAEDLRFVAAIIAAPQTLGGEKQVTPRQLLGRDPNDRDAQRLYAAALEIAGKQAAVTADAVLDALKDGKNPVEPLGAEERARLAGLLKDPPPADAVPGHVQRILQREASIGGRVGRWASGTLILFNIGAFIGIYLFSIITTYIGRRPTFAMAFLAAMISTAIAFLFMRTPADLFWMVPLMGACQLSIFGGYAIYFPELFPTRLRATGTSFCYNIARYVAVPGPAMMTGMAKTLFGHTAEPMRYAGVTMCACFLIGIVALIWAPETRGQPLPED
jgi:MFS family permease